MKYRLEPQTENKIKEILNELIDKRNFESQHNYNGLLSETEEVIYSINWLVKQLKDDNRRHIKPQDGWLLRL